MNMGGAHHRRMKDHRRAKVTDETIEESRRLRAIWDATPNKPSQAVFGELHGIGSQAAVTLFLNGRTPLSLKAASGFAKGLNCLVSDFSPRLAAQQDQIAPHTSALDTDFALVPQVDVKVSAGHGALVFSEGSKSALSFRRTFLQDIGVSERSAVVLAVKGHSMEPTIRDGAVLLVSTAAKTLLDRQVYAFRQDGHLYVKRMRMQGATVVAESDNPDRETYPDMLITSKDDDFEVIGRVLWMGARL